MVRRTILCAVFACALLAGVAGNTPVEAIPPLDNGGGWTTYPDMNDNSGIAGQAGDGEIPAVPDLVNNQTSLADIASAFNRARGIENANLCPAGFCEPGAAVMPTNLAFPADYANRSASERALWLLNSERAARGLLPFEGVDAAVAQNAQTWAQHLIDENGFHHQGQNHPDGRPSPSARAAIETICNGCVGNIGNNAAENLYTRSSFSLPNRAILDDFGLERAFYGWMYEDRVSGGQDQRWGHRHALLWNSLTNDHGPAGSEGFVGLGVARVNEDLFDPGGTFLGQRQAVVWVAVDSNANYPVGGGGGDTEPPQVTFPVPTVFVDLGSPQVITGTINDANSGVNRLEFIAIDLGAAGATGVPDLREWNGNAWGAARTVLNATINGNQWTINWDPVPGGSGSYVVGLRAFDNAGNKWPANRDWQALISISDTTAPTVTANAPTDDGTTVTWTGTAADDVAVRKVRMLVRHVASNEYWNGNAWVSAAAAANDPGVLLHAIPTQPLSPNTVWSFSFNPGRAGEFQTLAWSQNGAFNYSPSQPTTFVRQ